MRKRIPYFTVPFTIWGTVLLLVVAYILTRGVVSAAFLSNEPQGARQGQHQHGNAYAFWQSSNSETVYNIDQKVVISAKGPATYWALNWRWEDASYGGYMGLQTDGNRFDGTVGETAIFSLWNATDAMGPGCQEIFEDGTVHSCRIPFTIVPGRNYTYRLWRTEAVPEGQWWGAWILDGATEYYIGQILVPATHLGAAGILNFSEYFGPAFPCDSVPNSVARFDALHINQTFTYEFEKGTAGSCSGARVTTRK